MALGTQIHTSAGNIPASKPFNHGYSRRRRRNLVFHNYIKKLLKTWIFKWCIFTTIVANSLSMALETDRKVDYEFFAFFDVAEQMFLAIYTVEFIAKVYVDPIGYWKTSFNVFDFIVLMLSYIQRVFMLRNSRIMSWFHVVRPLRVLRAISLIRGLQVLVGALVKTIKNAIFVLFLLFLLMTAFALIAYNLYGDSKTGDFKNWGNLKSAYFTLFSLVTGTTGKSLEIKKGQKPLNGLQTLIGALWNMKYVSIAHWLLLTVLIETFKISGFKIGKAIISDAGCLTSIETACWGAGILLFINTVVNLDGWSDLEEETHQFGFTSSRFFIMCFILLGVFLFVNLFIGVIIITIRETSKEFNKGIQAERESTLMDKKQAILQRQQIHISEIMEKQKTSQFESFSEMIGKFKQTLRHDDFVMLDDICSSLTFVDIYLSSLDEQDNTLYQLQQLYFEISYVLGNVLRTVHHQNEKDTEVNPSPMEMEML